MNVWGIHNQMVPKGARRAVNRWKGPEPRERSLGEILDASPGRNRSYPQFVKSGPIRAKRAKEDVPREGLVRPSQGNRCLA